MKKLLSSSALVIFLATAGVISGQSVVANADSSSDVSTSQSSNNENSSDADKQKDQEQQSTDKQNSEQNKFVDYVKFTYSSGASYNAMKVNTSNIKSFVGPYNRGTKIKQKLNLNGELVQITKVAKAPQRTYYQISYRGQDQGWINADYVSSTSVYEIPFTYTSQHFPFDAPNGCEATALKMALSTKGVGENTDLNGFLKKMPRSSNNQNEGFVGNPYAVNHTSQNWTIYPKALAKFGREFYSGVYNITGASKIKIINEVQKGNPVIAATGYRMREATGHTLVVIGYKRGYFKMADPSSWKETYKTTNKPVFWVSTSQFMKLYNQEGRMAALVK
ncbi:C39 family peptidase [Apilactobacillus apisilvae]|uniref:C39 family peptidase n=1 Tax=Apilactobacillus apisilvae TaxID=2923364 RepID=A0ABY4PFA6_9LACO|nr:C39 family peptidase [Apilactobacillus apisilvae]UQS84499.1 C39 family peptidase [Apilactobacillus apisilvae]